MDAETESSPARVVPVGAGTAGGSEERCGNVVARPCGAVPGSRVRLALAAEAPPDVVTQRLAELGLDVVGRIGSGGMGVVFRARQHSVERAVAVKTLRPEFAADMRRVEAFVREAVVTGNLDHPNIVPVHDVQRAEDVGAFCIMKEVQGVSWDRVLARKSERENLDVLFEVCDAVAFAHHHGVVHRDLKPENIMLGDYGEVVVMDWGIAVAAADVTPTVNAPRLSPDSDFLEGTPEYMAPEMARHDVANIGTRSDVYLLGALLYRIVTGLEPHTGADPVACLEAAMANRIQPTARKGELVEVALKAMATDPAERYAGAKAFQEAIRSYIEHAESMDLTRIAREDLDTAELRQDYNLFGQALFGFRDALKLWPGNARAARGISDAALRYAACACARQDFDLAMSLLDPEDPAHFQQRQAAVHGRRMRQVRERRLHLLTRVSAGMGLALIAILASASVWIQFERVRAEAARDRAVAAEAEARGALRDRERENYYNVVNLARNQIDAGQLREAEQRIEATPVDLRGWEWGVLRLLCRPGGAAFDGMTGDAVADLAVSADGALAAAVGPGSTVRVWDMATNAPRLHLATYPGPVSAVALAPEASLVCFTTGSRAILWDLAAQEERHVLQAGDAVLTDVAFAPSGTWMATADASGQVRVWTVRTGRELRRLEGHVGRVHAVAFSADSHQLFSAGDDGSVRVWTVSSGNLRKCYTGHAGGALCVDVSPDGAMMAVGLRDGTVRVWDLKANEVFRILGGHSGPVAGVCFAPDAVRLASVSSDGTARIYGVRTGHTLKVLRGRSDTPFAAAAFAPDGTRLFTVGGPGKNAAWDSRHALTGAMTDVPRGEKLHRSTRLADGTALRLRNGAVEVVVPQGAGGGARAEPLVGGHAGAVTAATLSPDGRRFVTASADQTVKVWDVSTCREILTLRTSPPRTFTDLGFSADGRTLFALDGGGVAAWHAVAE